MTVFREETFGPVDAIYPVDGLEDGLALANDTNYGLSAAVWTRDIDKAMLYAHGIESGTVHINAATFYDEPHVPFGGVKDSGIGRGRHGNGHRGADRMEADHAATAWQTRFRRSGGGGLR